MKLKFAVVILFLFLILPVLSLFSDGFLQSPDSFQIDGGAGINYTFDDTSGQLNSSPAFRFYFGRVKTDGCPADEAAFLNQIGWVSMDAQIFSELKQRTMNEAITELDNTTVGMDIEIKWIWDKYPLTFTFPLEEKRIRWKYDEDDHTVTVAILRYHILAAEIGYYILPNMEISAGAGYLQPDLFYKSDWDYTPYSYLAWDIGVYLLQAKSVLELPDGMWISAESAVAFLTDEENNWLTTYSASIGFYPADSWRIGLHAATSDFTSGENYRNTFLEVMGATELGADIRLNILSFATVEINGSITLPKEEGYNPVYAAGGVLSVRL